MSILVGVASICMVIFIAEDGLTEGHLQRRAIALGLDAPAHDVFLTPDVRPGLRSQGCQVSREGNRQGVVSHMIAEIRLQK